MFPRRSSSLALSRTGPTLQPSAALLIRITAVSLRVRPILLSDIYLLPSWFHKPCFGKQCLVFQGLLPWGVGVYSFPSSFGILEWPNESSCCWLPRVVLLKRSRGEEEQPNCCETNRALRKASQIDSVLKFRSRRGR